MKPLQLSLQAFGPFASKQQIDFTALGENPLFLINGPTGAGKSSILDAICFALYGETTDPQREASAMRCDQADQDVLTEVILDFRLADQHYRVRRIPQQWRPKSRGEGVTEEKASATLWRIEDDGSDTLLVSKKVRQVNEEIENLTGLKVDQFRQVMVLPQGKFRELLLADSKQREEIFGQLFQTSIYKRIEERLKQQSADIRRNVEAHRHHIKGLLDAAEVGSQEDLEREQQALDEPLQEASELKSHAHSRLHKALQQREAAQQLIEQFKQREITQNQLAVLQARQPQIDTLQQQLDRAQKAGKMMPLFEKQAELEKALNAQSQSIGKTKLDMDALQQQLEHSQQALKLANEDFLRVDDLKAEIHHMQSMQQKIDDLQKAVEESKRATAQQAACQQQFDASQQQFAAMQDELLSQQQLHDRLQQQVAELGRSELALKTLEERWNWRQKLAQKIAESEQKQEELKQRQSEWLQQKTATEAAHQHARQTELAWHQSQACLLARELEADQPCPVCGSTEHPAPAQVTAQQNIVERAQVDDVRAAADEQSARSQQIEQQKNRIEIELQQLEKDQSELRQQLGEFAGHSLALVQQDLDQARKSFDALNQQQKQLEDLQQPIQKLQGEIERQQKISETLREELHQATTTAVQKQAALEHLQAEIPEDFRDPERLQANQEKIQTEINLLTQNRQQSEQHLQELQKSQSGLQATLAQLEKQQNNTRTEHQQAQQLWQQTLQQSVFSVEQDFQHALLDEPLQQSLSKQLQDYHDQLTTLQGSLAQQQNMLKHKTLPELEKLEQQCAQAEDEFSQSEKAWRDLDARAEALKSLAKKIQKEADRNAELERQYAIYGTLSDVASGRSHHKISLQRFVLSVLLDDVLLQASQRLAVMSSGRYQLLRRDQRSKGNAASGLQLDVEDAYTGKMRSVATLSGGESFMAALSLALGLSDVVQAYAGGIRLDMLFIDEGFGSLDQESLDLAIRTLIDLQASGRMIGIISHVSELKEQMALRLDVHAGHKGSTVKLIG